MVSLRVSDRVIEHEVFFFVTMAAFGQALRDRVETQCLLGVSHIATEPDDLLRRVREADSSRAIVVLDADAPGAAEVADLLRRDRRDARVVVLGLREDPTSALMWARLGANALLSRDVSLQDVVSAIGSVSNGEAPCSPMVAAALLRALGSPAARKRSHDRESYLTPRERQIAFLLSDGLTNKQIAAKLQVELGTVKNHVHSIIQKLGICRRSQVAGALRGSARDDWHNLRTG
jgi:two-component system, NarL family, nitrate/nitrite response regulator NarL